MSKPEVIVINESLTESVAKDAITFAMVVGVVCVGRFLGSAALEWIGGFMALITIISCAGRLAKNNSYTIAGARRRLDELEGKI